MSLTTSFGPLSPHAGPTNYEIRGPAHRILLHDVSKRVRVELGGETVADTMSAKMLHESNLLPVYYLPLVDVRQDLLQRTDHTTYCRFKGHATYWSVRAGDRIAENAVWGYEQPNEELSVLRGLVAFYLGRVDAVYEEDEQLPAHPRDPFHRVDIRRSSRHVRVTAADVVLADTTRPKGVFETGLPARWYVPAEDVDLGLLRDSDTRTVCPYKGVARYWSLAGGAEDVAWSYAEPDTDGQGLEGYLCFAGEAIHVAVNPG